MAIRNYHPFTVAGVLARMTDMAGTRYRAAQLAIIFDVTPKEVRDILDRLLKRDLIKTAAVDGDRKYWVPEEAEVQAAKYEPYRPAFRPLNGYEKTMRRFAEMAESGR